jgi:hypothetical protein
MASPRTTKKSGDTSGSEEGAKKSPARKSPAKKSGGASSGARKSAPRAEASRKTSAREVAAKAASELLELTGKDAEGVTGLERTDDGWTVQVEVVEVHRIPNTTDVLALYEVRTDERGELESYRRLRRYARGVPGDD